MGSILALLIIIFISLLVVRIGSNALVLTGMSAEAARFQACSAFFGVGFTTAEAEIIMRSTVRRKIVTHLIIAGNIGLTSALATVIVTVVKSEGTFMEELVKLSIGVGCIILTVILLNLEIVKKPLDIIMKKSLGKVGVVHALDYDLLFNIQDGYGIIDVKICKDHWLCDQKLMHSRPSDDGVLILAIHFSDEGFLGAPDKDTTIHENDLVMFYGKKDAIEAYSKKMKEDKTPKELR